MTAATTAIATMTYLIRINSPPAHFSNLAEFHAFLAGDAVIFLDIRKEQRQAL